MYYLKDETDPTYPAASLQTLVGAITMAMEMRMHCGGHWRVVDYYGGCYWDTGRASPPVTVDELYW